MIWLSHSHAAVKNFSRPIGQQNGSEFQVQVFSSVGSRSKPWFIQWPIPRKTPVVMRGPSAWFQPSDSHLEGLQVAAPPLCSGAERCFCTERSYGTSPLASATQSRPRRTRPTTQPRLTAGHQTQTYFRV
eukprot:168961-Chlamydomonas_euryale.AAC.1